MLYVEQRIIQIFYILGWDTTLVQVSFGQLASYLPSYHLKNILIHSCVTTTPSSSLVLNGKARALACWIAVDLMDLNNGQVTEVT